MAEFFNSHFQVFLPEKDVHESILLENLVPLNVYKPKVIDDFLTPLTTMQVCSELSLKEIQWKMVKVMGPLSQVWKDTEDVKSDTTKEITLSLKEVATSLDKSVLLLLQAFQPAAIHGRYNALSSVMKDHKKLKETLREQCELLSTECYLEAICGKISKFCDRHC